MVLFVQKPFSKARQARLDAEKEIQIAAQELLDVQQVRHKIEVEGIVLHRVSSCFIVFHRVPLCPLCPFFHHFYQILLTD